MSVTCSSLKKNFTPVAENLTSNTISILIISSMKKPFTINVPPTCSIRDIYLEISLVTSLSRTFFSLSTKDSKALPDKISPISEFEISNGTKIYLSVNIQSGLLKTKIAKMSAAQKSIRAYVFAMKPEQVRDFFNAEYQVEIKLKLPSAQMGRLRFKLDRPLSQDPDHYTRALERLFDFGQTNELKNVSKTSNTSYTGQFHGDLPPDVFSSSGVPARTVDTVVAVLDNLIRMVEWNLRQSNQQKFENFIFNSFEFLVLFSNNTIMRVSVSFQIVLLEVFLGMLCCLRKKVTIF